MEFKAFIRVEIWSSMRTYLQFLIMVVFQILIIMLNCKLFLVTIESECTWSRIFYWIWGCIVQQNQYFFMKMTLNEITASFRGEKIQWEPVTSKNVHIEIVNWIHSLADFANFSVIVWRYQLMWKMLVIIYFRRIVVEKLSNTTCTQK